MIYDLMICHDHCWVHYHDTTIEARPRLTKKSSNTIFNSGGKPMQSSRRRGDASIDASASGERTSTAPWKRRARRHRQPRWPLSLMTEVVLTWSFDRPSARRTTSPAHARQGLPDITSSGAAAVCFVQLSQQQLSLLGFLETKGRDTPQGSSWGSGWRGRVPVSCGRLLCHLAR